ncbi:glycosyl hydrolase 115 family protein [Prevotella cerevisiae]|uniref:Glycosyl hydrolase 115 family protein n=1 Tax=Segatella cerevisiae TaxID=2053716 RepID=A0ABT1BZD4_9BACT|nr:glycosyl hydrolase 115 family protein [Segatella cerevisiae]MCO6026200.1 glycosyl hydrolase 115 family protein [Segatella cerevisiae]
MKKIISLGLVLSLFLPVSSQVSLVKSGDKGFPVYTSSQEAPVLYNGSDALVIGKVASLFSDDVKRVTGHRLRIINSDKEKTSLSHAIIVGTLRESSLIKDIVNRGKIDTIGLTRGWERYRIQLVRHPLPGIKSAIVIAGSDRRGAAYGLLSLSKAIGVNPWYWWMDAPVQHHRQLTVQVKSCLSPQPSVKYRGIFINDEDWGLQPWAAKNFEKRQGNIGPRTYAKVCELLLRLQANYLCPAMHNCSTAFYQIAENKLVADTFAIAIGTSHCEPLGLNTASEWSMKKYGDWDYANNSYRMDSVLRSRVEESAPYESVYTIALRGLHDVPMKAGKDMAERRDLMQRALESQRKILSDVLGKKVEDIPQVFTPYKEVLDVYDAGLKVPDDVTIIWPDDDYGYMKRLSGPKEQLRSGRAGVYYHASYLGRPHNNLWMNSTSPVFMYEELNKAYCTTADRVWLLNAGDIKSCEFAVDFFLNLAYDIHSFNYQRVADYRSEWTATLLGDRYRKDYREIFRSFYNLAFQRRPEFMGWGVQWTSDRHGREKNTDTEFSLINYREAERRMAEYRRIGNKVSELLRQMPSDSKPCFFESVYYPVKGCELMNCKFLLAQKNRWYAFQHRAATNRVANESEVCYDSLNIITHIYNTILNGKWNHVIAMRQNDAASDYERPELRTISLAPEAKMGLFVEGEELIPGFMGYHTLPAFNKYLPQSHFIDIFDKGSVPLSWRTSTSERWIKLSVREGNTSTEQRVEVSIDWKLVPKDDHLLGKVVFISSSGERDSVIVPVFNPATPSGLPSDSLFVEDDGYVSIDAAHFSRKSENQDIKIHVIPNLGCEGSCVQLGDPIAPSQNTRERNVPYVEYDFYTFEQGPVDVYTYVLPTFTLSGDEGFAGHESTNLETQYGVAIDGNPIALASTSSFEYAQEWYSSVLRNTRINKNTLYVGHPGKHTLRIVCGNAGTLLQKIVLDFGGLKHSYMGPQPTRKM